MSFSYVDILIVAVQDRRRLFYICLASGGKYDTNVSKAQGVSNARGEERGKKMTQVFVIHATLLVFVPSLALFSRSSRVCLTLSPHSPRAVTVCLKNIE